MKQEVLQMVFDLGEGRQESIRVYLDSNPNQLAQDFCNLYQLKPDAVQVIEEQIWSNLQQIFNEQQSVQQSSSKVNIFERLHNEATVKAKRKQKQEIQNTLHESRAKTPQINHNPGAELYKKGIQHRENQERMQEMKKVEQSLTEKQYPFRPFVSERSQHLARRPQIPMQDYLLMKGKEMSQRKEYLRNSRFNMESQECSFRPQINEMYFLFTKLNFSSEKINYEKQRQNPIKEEIHERLYKEGLMSQQKKKQEPSISFTKQSKISSFLNDIPFLERMQQNILERQKRLEQSSQSVQDISLDSNTGQRLFHPNVGRPPMADRNVEHLPIGEYLYQMKNVKDQSHYNLLVQDKLQRENSRAKSSDKSNLIYEQKKRKSLEEIFYLLDSDGDGYISAQSINISQMPPDVLQILSPLLCEMEQIGANLNLNSFIDAANRLIQTLPIVDRDKILNGLRPRKIVEPDQCTFQPALNQRSLKMINTKSQIAILASQKKENLKRQQDESEMSECTFKPRLFQPMKFYEFMLNS